MTEMGVISAKGLCSRLNYLSLEKRNAVRVEEKKFIREDDETNHDLNTIFFHRIPRVYRSPGVSCSATLFFGRQEVSLDLQDVFAVLIHLPCFFLHCFFTVEASSSFRVFYPLCSLLCCVSFVSLIPSLEKTCVTKLLCWYCSLFPSSFLTLFSASFPCFLSCIHPSCFRSCIFAALFVVFFRLHRLHLSCLSFFVTCLPTRDSFILLCLSFDKKS